MKVIAEKHNNIITFLGIILLVISCISIFNAFYFADQSILFWFCYLSLPLAGIGMLIKNSNLIKSQFYILILPDLIWSIDFIVHLVKGTSFLGITDYVFLPGYILPKIITFQHLIMLPIMAYTILVIKTNKENSWKISILQGAIIFALTRFFTLPIENINCAFDICGNYHLQLTIYPFIWFGIFLLMVYVSRAGFIKFHSIFYKNSTA